MTTNENEAKDRRVVIVAGAQGVTGSDGVETIRRLSGYDRLWTFPEAFRKLRKHSTIEPG